MTKQRAHSKFSASGAERWFNCPGAVTLSESLPDVDTEASLAGTRAHGIHEALTVCLITKDDSWAVDSANALTHAAPIEMVAHASDASEFVFAKAKELKSELLVETRIGLKFIHPEMFGTFDDAILQFKKTLHIFDFKFGTHPVSPRENLQMIFYALGMAYRYNWEFKLARLWIMQPRTRGYDGPIFWDVSIRDLKEIWRPRFEKAVDRVEKFPHRYQEGEWCFFCKAKRICPLKKKSKQIFGSAPINGS